MSEKSPIASALKSRVIALPESRQLDILAALFERRQARVLRVPLVSIHDAPDQEGVGKWLRDFIAEPPHVFIILTGEGLRRLRAAAARQQLETEFVAALGKVIKVCRGPKPGRALKEVNLQPDQVAPLPTTEGVITALQSMRLENQRVAVQLYGQDPNPTLMAYLNKQRLRACLPVAPYVYHDDAETAQVVSLIDKLAAGEVDMIAFTSKPQVRRLFSVARQQGCESGLREGLARTLVAAVGPVVRDELQAHGCPVTVMPASSYFMKPLVRAAEAAFAAHSRSEPGAGLVPPPA